MNIVEYVLLFTSMSYASLIVHSIGGDVAVFWWIWISWDIIWAELPMLPCIIYWKGRNSLFILWLLNLLTLGIVPMSSEVLFWIRDVSFLFCCFINHSCLCIMLRIIDRIVYLFLIDSFGLVIDFCDSHFLFFFVLTIVQPQIESGDKSEPFNFGAFIYKIFFPHNSLFWSLPPFFFVSPVIMPPSALDRLG